LTQHSRRGEMFSHNASALRCAAVVRERGYTQKSFCGVRQYAISVFTG
jgi:hypothetical protein